MPPASEALEAAKKRVRDAVVLFEHKEGSKLVDTKDIGTLVRSLGVNPSQAQVTTILDQLSTLTPDSLLASEYVENVVANFLVSQQSALFRDDYHTLIRAFRAFDTEGKGYLDQDQFRAIMGSKGETMNDEELNRMILYAADENGKIFYEDYAQKLCNDGRKI